MFRVLGAFKLNPYEVLGITLTSATDPDAINSMVKKAYRTKSLLLHPDKLKHARGPESFDVLKKASLFLSLHCVCYEYSFWGCLGRGGIER